MSSYVVEYAVDLFHMVGTDPASALMARRNKACNPTFILPRGIAKCFRNRGIKREVATIRNVGVFSLMAICIPRFFPAVLQGFFCFEINSLKQVCEEEYNARKR